MTLRQALEARVAAGQTEALGGVAFAPLLELDSGRRYGLVLPPDDGEVGWAFAEGDRLVKFAKETARH
jgi:hypothetical protein